MTVTVAGDLLDEFDENFTLNLSNSVNATISDGLGLGTITDNDALPILSVDDVTVTEGDAGTVNAIFTVSLNTVSGRALSVDYATANGSATAPADYASAADRLDFAAGETTKTVAVTVNADLLDEANETFNVNLANATNATIGDGQGIGTITDDDATPSLAIGDVTVTEGDAGTTNANFTVTLSAPSGRTVSAGYATADGTATAPADFVAATGTVSFAAGETTRTITVAVNGDLTDEIDETFSVNLTGPVNATITDAEGIGTITDDDAAAEPVRRRRDGHRGQRQHRQRGLHRQPQLGERQDRDRRPRDGRRHRDGAGRLRGRHRVADLHAGPDDQDGDRGRGRRLARRDRRDLHPQPLGRGQCDDRGRERARHDPRQRRARRRSASTT